MLHPDIYVSQCPDNIYALDIYSTKMHTPPDSIYSVDYSKSSQLQSKLEVELLQEYQRLAILLKNLSTEIETICRYKTSDLMENLAELETKISLVFTLYKGAVYSLFLQQEGQLENAVPEGDASPQPHTSSHHSDDSVSEMY